MIADVPLGAFLSGGVDSSSIVAMMWQDKKDVHAYSIGVSEFKPVDETSYAKIVAADYATTHKIFDLQADLFDSFDTVMNKFDEPFGISSAFALYYLSRLAREEVVVALTGDGGDEIFGGYTTRYHRDKRLSNFSWLPYGVPRFGVRLLNRLHLADRNPISLQMIRLRCLLDSISYPKDIVFMNTVSTFNEFEKQELFNHDIFSGFDVVATDRVFQRFYKQINFNDELQRRLYGDIKTKLHDEMLTKVDRMSMACGLEARVPLLDHELVQFVFNINSKYKIKGRDNGKVIFKKAMEKYLPHGLLYREKSGFAVPMDFWFKNQLQNFVNEMLSETELRKHNLFNYEYVRKIIEFQRKGVSFSLNKELSNQIFLLIIFQVWFNSHCNRVSIS